MSVPEIKGNIVALIYNFIKDPIGFLDHQFALQTVGITKIQILNNRPDQKTKFSRLV